MITRYLVIYALIALGYVFALMAGAREFAVQAMENYTKVAQDWPDSDALADPAPSPENTMRQIESKSQNWNEPSLDSEERYVKAYNQWLDRLPIHKRDIARRILADAHKNLSDLRQAIRQKKAELASISFDRVSSPKQLSRLGVELRSLQASLYKRLSMVSRRMRDEAGVEMGKLDRQSLWLMPPAAIEQMH